MVGVGDQRKRKEEAREQKWLLIFGREFFFAVEAFVGQQTNNLCEPPSLTLSLYFSVFFLVNFEFFLFFFNALIARKFDPVCFWISDLDSVGPDFGGVVSGVEWKG